MIEDDVRAVLDAMRRPPFNLDDEGIAWVEQTLAALDEDEKVGQLFCNVLVSFDRAAFVESLKVCKPGGVGTVGGAMVGGLVMAVMTNGMQLMGVPTSIQQIVKGLVLLLAVAFDIWNKRRAAAAKA